MNEDVFPIGRGDFHLAMLVFRVHISAEVGMLFPLGRATQSSKSLCSSRTCWRTRTLKLQVVGFFQVILNR